MGRIFHPLFLLSLFLLIGNDFFWKYEYHNILTGKLSDIAGLFAFPFLISSLFPKKVDKVYFLTFLLFLFWKSPFSNFLIMLFESTVLPIDRVIDYSDLLALLILPLSYKVWNNQKKNKYQPKILKVPLIALCGLSFVATTLPTAIGDYNLKSNLTLEINTEKEYTLEMIQGNSVKINNSSYYYYLPYTENGGQIKTRVEILKVNESKSQLKLDSIINYIVPGKGSLLLTRYDDEVIEFFENLSQKGIEKRFIDEINSY